MGRFWPNVECWIATKMWTQDGLVPADNDRLRIQVHGILSAAGQDPVNQDYVIRTWQPLSVQEAINTLSKDDIFVTNKKDKDVNLKVLASLDEQIRRLVSLEVGEEVVAV